MTDNQSNTQKTFLSNYETAKAAGVKFNTGEAVYHAILRGNSYVNFPSGVASLDDDYVSYVNDELFNRTVEQGLS